MAAEQVAGTPHPLLRSSVTSYVGYRSSGLAPGTHAGLPSPSLTLIVSFDQPLELAAMPDPAQPPSRFWAMIGGLHAAPATVRHNGNQHGVQLAVTPHGARRLFGVPAGELGSTVLPLEEVVGPRAATLVERLQTAATWAERFAVLDEVLLQQLGAPKPVRPELDWAWRRLSATSGQVPVGSLADELGWTRRHLSGQFRREYGLSPKVAGRVMRFERARGLLAAGGGRRSLADVAALAGFADQAHMTRDWRTLAGSTPAAWLAAEVFPSVQDDEVRNG